MKRPEIQNSQATCLPQLDMKVPSSTFPRAVFPFSFRPHDRSMVNFHVPHKVTSLSPKIGFSQHCHAVRLQTRASSPHLTRTAQALPWAMSQTKLSQRRPRAAEAVRFCGRQGFQGKRRPSYRCVAISRAGRMARLASSMGFSPCTSVPPRRLGTKGRRERRAMKKTEASRKQAHLDESSLPDLRCPTSCAAKGS